MGRPGVVWGAACGALLTVPLIALFFAAWRVAGLPFVPFDLFDALSRVLPGRLAENLVARMTTFRSL